MKHLRFPSMILPFVLLATASVVLIGCEAGSADSVTRNLDVDFSGFYVGNSGPLVSKNSGNPVTQLNLRQNGDQLEAIDNNNLVFRGTIGSFDGTTGSFEMTGKTTAGQPVTMDGTLTGEGTTGTMKGTWVEPSFYATISGTATINPVPTNAPPNTNTVTALSVDPSSATLNTDGDTKTFTASGGTGTGYHWTLGDVNKGVVNTANGATVQYQRVHAGTNTLTVTDSASSSATAIIKQP
jgi:hypothetical protein